MVKLGDLGLGRVMSVSSSSLSPLDSVSNQHHAQPPMSMVGTPYYMSPEMISGNEYNYSCDIWAFGCLIYEMCMLSHPFQQNHNNPFLLAQSILQCSFSPVQGYSQALTTLVHSMLDVNNQQRPRASQIVSLSSVYAQTHYEDYINFSIIGRGKHSIVYKCQHKYTLQYYALKQIFEMEASCRNEIINEAKLHRCIPEHPNIIHLHGDLSSIIQQNKQNNQFFNEFTIWLYFCQIAEAVRHLHQCRVLHRDIKPANVFLNEQNTLKLGDLGLGRQFSSKTQETFSIVGTPLYMSPEAIQHQGYSFSSDIWSLGCVLYELCSLHSPFYIENDLNYYHLGQKIKNCQYPPIPSNYSPMVLYSVYIPSHSRSRAITPRSIKLNNLIKNMIVVDCSQRLHIDQICEITHQALNQLSLPL